MNSREQLQMKQAIAHDRLSDHKVERRPDRANQVLTSVLDFLDFVNGTYGLQFPASANVSVSSNSASSRRGFCVPRALE